MEASKLWQVFSLLEPVEQNQLDRLLESPFFNRRQDVCQLFRQLREAARTSEEIPTREDLWQAVFPQASFDKADFNRLCNRLLKLIETYLAQVQDFSSPFQEEIGVARFYHTHHAPALAKSLFQRSRKRLEALPQKGSIYFHDRYLLEREAYNTSSKQDSRLGQGLPLVSLHLDQFFFLEKLKLACSQAAQRNISAETDPIDFLEVVLEKIVTHLASTPPLIQAYFHAYRMLALSEGAEDYQLFRKVMGSHGSSFPLEEQRGLYLMALNFSIRKLNQGASDYLREVFQLYQLGLADHWLFERGALSPWTYKNIVSAGLKLKEFDWVEEFLKAYQERLPEENQKSHYRYNLAEVQLARGEYREVLRNLRFLQFREPLTHLRSRILQVRASIELGDSQLAEYQLASLKQLLQRRKSLAYHKENYLRFVRFARRLLFLEPGDAGAKAALKDEIAAAAAFVEKEWLLQKLGSVA